MDATRGKDVDAALGQLRQASSALAPARARVVACAVARRHLAVLSGDAGPLPALVDLVLERGSLAAADLEGLDAVFDELHAGIDPDRLDAMDRRRALGVLRLALASCAEPPGVTLFDVVRAALGSRALRHPSVTDEERAAEREELRRRWAWDAVQDEVRWLDAAVAAG